MLRDWLCIKQWMLLFLWYEKKKGELRTKVDLIEFIVRIEKFPYDDVCFLSGVGEKING